MRIQILGKLSTVSSLTVTEVELSEYLVLSFFHQKVLNAFGIIIPRHERFDDFNFIV